MMNIKQMIKQIIPIQIIRKVRGIFNQRIIDAMGKTQKLPFEKDCFPKGINLIGSFTHNTGLGQSCRLLEAEIQKAGLAYTRIHFSPFGNEKEYHGGYAKQEFTYGINIWHVNMHEFFFAYRMFGRDKWDKHYNIAFWLWEMQEFPGEWIPMINQLDEIWTPSEFVSNALRKVTDKPVFTVPYAVDAPTEHADRAYFGLPEDKFLFLMMFDTNSISERKNPKAVIAAFKQAFAKDTDDVGLVIKIGNASRRDLEELKEALSGYHYYFIEKTLEKKEVNSLIKCCDVYVSLHRAEGFGLVIAEAMFLGTPVIATNYSSNTEFQTDETSAMVDYRLCPIGHDLWPYKKEYYWAEPDIGMAAQYMKKYYSDKSFYSEKSSSAKAYIREKLNISLAADIIKKRVEVIDEYTD